MTEPTDVKKISQIKKIFPLFGIKSLLAFSLKLLDLIPILTKVRASCSHFIDQETEAKSNELVCPRSQSHELSS